MVQQVNKTYTSVIDVLRSPAFAKPKKKRALQARWENPGYQSNQLEHSQFLLLLFLAGRTAVVLLLSLSTLPGLRAVTGARIAARALRTRRRR
jgi:hypothetical protein